jgi:hypothetical protein
VGGKELAEYLEVQGYAHAAKWVYTQALEPQGWGGTDLLTVTEVRGIHHTTMSLVWEVAPHHLAGPDEAPGSFRRHDIQTFRSGMTPPPWTEVPAQVTDWVARVCRLPDIAEPQIEALASLHAEFERIHPFIDGNGRVGRLLANLILVRLGYPPAIIYKRDRPRYLHALRSADAGDSGGLGEMFARAVLDNHYRFVLPAVAGPLRMVPISALVTEQVTLRALRNAAERSRLAATKRADGQWLSTRKAVDEYIVSRYQRVDPSIASATCGKCGAVVPDPGDLPPQERMPCPKCKSTSVNFRRTIRETLSTTEAPANVSTSAGQPPPDEQQEGGTP